MVVNRSQFELVQRERDLYRRLLELGAETEIEPFLREALSIVVEVTGAAIGYLELHDPMAPADDPGWFMAHGTSPAESDELRRAVSRGIIAQAMATGTTIDTPAAQVDPRFSDRASVQVRQIEAVLCVPVGSDPPRGAVYLQGSDVSGPFGSEARRSAEIFAGQLDRLASQLLASRRSEPSGDPTQPYRAVIRADGLIGRSEAIAALLRDMSQVAPLDVGVLLTGDSGTGKSLVARLIHENSPRHIGPFVELSCGAIPEGLVESELFGAMAGAHSTATRRMTGKVEAAERGTLFLDEVSELHASAQVKLLQLLQSKVYFPLGSTKAVHANIRIIAATNSDLKVAVDEGRFREDLYFRLHVLPIRVPALAERTNDIAELAAHFVDLAAQAYGLPLLPLSPGAIEHALEAALVRATGERASQIEASHVFPDQKSSSEFGAGESITFQEATRRFQADYLASVLDETGWNVSEAARRLDLARSHVYTLIRAFGLERRQDDVRR
jgi:Nif-specific regulatory protein